jgi:hypothetical protein
MVYIGMDISKISTAICVESSNKNFFFSYTTKKENNKWIKKLNKLIQFRFINYKYSKEENYSNIELLKLDEFDTITNLIIKDILKYIKNKNIKIGIEGYSYNSKGPIFDLIEFSTLLKHKLLKYTKRVEIISPLTLKVETCKLSYKPRKELIGKRVIKEVFHYENKDGKKARSFDKWDMFDCFLMCESNTKLKEWCIENNEDVKKVKDVPKPLDDIIDAFFIKEIIKK